MDKKKAGRQPVSQGVAKVPVVIQMEMLECGAACLTMVLAYYGKWLPLEQVRLDCGVSRDGSNARNILLAARSYGLEATGYRYEPEMLRTNGRFPCIIHWNFNHFVVLCGFKKDKAVLNDPAKGTYAVSMETFDKSFTGICLMMAPGPQFQAEGKPKSLWKFARKRLTGTGAAFALVVVTTVITSLLGIIMPGFANLFADRLLTGRSPNWAGPFLWGLAGVSAIQIVVAWIQAVYRLKADGKMAIVANAQYMWHVLRMPMEFFAQRMAGDIAGRKEQNALIAADLVSTFAPLAIQGAMLVFYLWVMLRYSWVLTLIGVASILLNLLITRQVSRKRVDLTRVTSRDSGKLAGATVAGIEMIESIKASGAENGYFEKWAGYQASVNAGKVRFARINAQLGLLAPLVTSLANAVVFTGSVYLCVRGEWTVGMIAAFSGFLSAFLAPAQEMLTASETFQEMRTQMERVEDVLEYPVDPACSQEEQADAAAGEGAALAKLSGALELRNVTFGYSRLAPPLIENFSMRVEPGQRVAFVGGSGSGKSTLAKLISNLYQPWSGEILMDGKPVGQIPRSVFTGSVAVVDQDIILFEDTIANNIKMWDQSIEDFEMILAARDAQLHEDIMAREGGYQHRLAEGGKDLSGGQRQRMEIARVLAQDPTLVILDEATSALDAKTEFQVVKAIKDRGVTCVVVAHRLSTIRDCDEIIVLDKGKVVERGTHEELYAKGGAYAKLVASE